MCNPESADALASVSQPNGEQAGIHVKSPQDGTIKDPIAKLRKSFRDRPNQVKSVVRRYCASKLFLLVRHHLSVMAIQLLSIALVTPEPVFLRSRVFLCSREDDPPTCFFRRSVACRRADACGQSTTWGGTVTGDWDRQNAARQAKCRFLWLVSILGCLVIWKKPLFPDLTNSFPSFAARHLDLLNLGWTRCTFPKTARLAFQTAIKWSGKWLINLSAFKSRISESSWSDAVNVGAVRLQNNRTAD